MCSCTPPGEGKLGCLDGCVNRAVRMATLRVLLYFVVFRGQNGLAQRLLCLPGFDRVHTGVLPVWRPV